MTQIIIGVSGDNGTGKSTLASALGKHFELEVPYSGVGDEIRYYVAAKHHIPLDVCFQKPTPNWLRKLLIKYGAQNRKDGDRYYWAKKWIKRIGERSTAVGDVRFLPEWEIIHARGGILIFLGEPTDQAYQLPQLAEKADLRLDIKPEFNDALIGFVTRLLRSKGHDV